MAGVPVNKKKISVDFQGNGLERPFSDVVEKKMPQSDRPFQQGLGADIPMFDIAFMRLPEVKAVTGLSKTSIYELIRERSFPAPIRLGPRAVAWVKSEVRQWAVERVQASRSVA
jgi:prophage regulatory protein